ncbi:MAG: hypothetical protein O2894_01935 [Planctomycetota bacterium]|nr:hypothetical protein [Planctomycetota bacterium]
MVESSNPGTKGGSGFGLSSRETDETKLDAYLARASADGKRIWFSPLIERELPPRDNGDVPTEQALLGFVFLLDLRSLYRRGGPLHDDLTAGDVGEDDRLRLSPQHWHRARRFADEHLRNGLFRPTAVLEHGWDWMTIFAFKRARVLTEGSKPFLLNAQRIVAQFLHAAQSYAWDARIMIEDLFLEERTRKREPMRLHLFNPKLRLDPTRSLEEGSRLLDELAKHGGMPAPARSAPVPPEMGLLTLAPDWTIGDWALGARLRQILASGIDEGGVLSYREVVRVVEAAAERGHGWRDIEKLLADPRYSLHSLLAAGGRTILGMEHVFRRALARRDRRYPTRLAWGLRVAPVTGYHPGEIRRYRLSVKRAGQWVHRDVPWDALSSAVKCRRTVAAMLERVLEPVTQRVWDAVLGLTMADPRCLRPIEAGGSKPPRALTACIEDFLQAARPYVPPCEGLSSTDPAGWPLIRDGVVLFPRAVLEAFFAGKATVGAIGRKELTRAIESLGGGERGVCYFAGSGRIRVWFCPLPAPSRATKA